MQSPRTKSTRAFTLTELLVTIACMMVAATIFLSILAKSGARSSKLGCTNNLKQIGLAFRTFAIDNDGHYPMHESLTNGGSMELVSNGLVFPHFRVMSNELSTPKILACPSDQNKTYATNFDSGLTDTHLSYFINVDAVEENGSSLLCGDRNLNNKAPAGSRFFCLSNTSVIGWTRKIHGKKGNLCFVDGSVVGFTNGDVGLTLRMPAGVINRLAVP